MRKTLVLTGAIAAGAYLLGRRADTGAKHYTLLQRAALIYTSPRAAGARRALKRLR